MIPVSPITLPCVKAAKLLGVADTIFPFESIVAKYVVPSSENTGDS